MKRRKFLQMSSLGALAVPPVLVGAPLPRMQARSERLPVVISTWNHGLAANEGAWKVLAAGGKSLDAIEQGLRITEADVSNRSVGIGGLPDAKGKVTLDACIMDEKGRCGAVAFLEGIDHPISVARRVMEDTPHVMLVGQGAYEFARQKGFNTIKTPVPEAKAAYEAWKKAKAKANKRPTINHENHDTIGMLAIDQNGTISGGCTTSGWAYKMHGRVGDSPIIGAGLFIDPAIGGAVATGLGEAIIRIAGSHTVVEIMRQGKSPQEACEEAVRRIIAGNENLEGLQCCFLAINTHGEVGAFSVFNGFNFAYTTEQEHILKDAAFDRTW